jgi:hypothetical protein
MRRYLVLPILLLATTAHAMGTDVVTDPIAWNPDGTAVLLATATNRDMDKTLSYTIMFAATDQPVHASLSQTSRDNGHDDEQLSVADCTKAAQQLAAAVAAASFAGVVIHPEACKRDRGAIVTIAASQQKLVAQSWVALPQVREASPREQLALDALAVVEPAYQPSKPSDRAAGTACEGIDVAALSGKLAIAVKRFACGNPEKTHVFAFSPGAKDAAGKTSVVARGED